MALQVRRVITGHDANGRAVVKIDEVCKHAASGRPGATAVNIWTTEGFPVNNDGAADDGLRKVGTTLAKGRSSASSSSRPSSRRATTGRTRSTTS